MKHQLRQRLLLWSAALLILPMLVACLVIAGNGLQDDLARVDVALVLGNRVETDGTPAPRTQARLDKTVALYRQGYFSRIIVSGATGKEGYDEAVAMRDYLLQKGIPATAIITDSQGRNTFHSAAFTAAYLSQHGLHSVMAISQYFHLPRSRLALERFGIKAIYTAPADWFEWGDLYSLPREAVAYGYYWWRDYPSPNDLIR